ncbi:rRNA maturation RNase YbeY [Prosthecomicrobium pneumaticum]|uniref:Endoribonuclease YbeY n=1 Tax=Prosthecomicrobium pneumaticum TaxID=81895 RepID=A0A7W9FNV2_9HYPH|nr:putative rRNA maturation factor [Prosthecomicrobium pneumaticum]
MNALSEEIAIDVIVEAGDWPEEETLCALVERAVDVAIDVAGVRLAQGAELAVLFTDDAHIARLNADWRDKPKPTNVLSFPATPAGSARLGPLVGDIVLAGETIRAEAGDQGVSFEAHLTHLVVHGFLHLAGHDHIEDDEAERMERLETAILARLGIADPYADPATGEGDPPDENDE